MIEASAIMKRTGLPGWYGYDGSGQCPYGDMTMPWLTPVVFKQGPNETLAQVPLFDDGPKTIQFRHIVHAYRDAAFPENTTIQSITFDTIASARGFAAPNLNASCAVVTFPEDIDMVPAGFEAAPALERDVSNVVQCAVQRRLPLLFDILWNGASVPPPMDNSGSKEGATGTRGLAHARSDPMEFLVLTNSDIHLQPTF